VVAPDALQEAALAAARELAGVDANAHTATKLRVREQAIAGVRDGIDRITGTGREW
jgi:enoyl-CoA hydratase/carnithine racemase